MREGLLRPILYLSHTLLKSQWNYVVTEKECYAVVYALGQLRKYLRAHRFLVVSDHRSLLWLHRNQAFNSRLMRWAVFLNEFDFSIVHRPGTANLIADALSRLKNCAQPILPTNPLQALDVDNVDVSNLEALPCISCSVTMQRSKFMVPDCAFIGRYLRIPASQLKLSTGSITSTSTSPILYYVEGFRHDCVPDSRQQDTWLVRSVKAEGVDPISLELTFDQIIRFLIPYDKEIQYLPRLLSAPPVLPVTRAQRRLQEASAVVPSAANSSFGGICC